MKERKIGTVAARFALAAIFGTAAHAIAQDATTPYMNMAPIDQYLMQDRNETMVDGAELSCACIRHGVEKPNMKTKDRKQNTKNLRRPSLSPFGVAFFFSPLTFALA